MPTLSPVTTSCIASSPVSGALGLSSGLGKYIVGSIERPDGPTLWAVGVGNNKKQCFWRALHLAMALTLAQEVPDDHLTLDSVQELVRQVTNVRKELAATE